jgi:hypothetical protein
MTYGVTPEGFVRPTVQNLKQLFEQDQLDEIAPTLDVSSDSLVGQLNGIYARHLGIAWEALEAVYDSNDPDKAEDAALTALSKLTGTERRAASRSRVSCTVNLDEGTTLLAGEHFAHVEDDPDTRFTPVEDFTAPSDGNHDVVFEAENTGPITVQSETLTVIATTVSGWNSITNPNPATPGRNIDSNATLRERREAQLTASGSTTTAAIRADLLELEAIEAVLALENTTSAGVDGLPPHSFEMVIWDGGLQAADDNEVAQTIWDNKPSGIGPQGSSSGIATDSNGDEHSVRFTRATSTPIHIAIELTPREGYVGEETFKATLAERCNELFGIADDVSHYDVLLSTGGLGARVADLNIGFTSNPTAGDDLAIGQRAIARFSAENITITEV